MVELLTLLYGSESWNTTVQEEKRLTAFHTGCLRRILGVPWQDRVPNEVIFERTSQIPLINILRHKRLTWTCHPYAPNSLAPPLAPLGTTTAPSPRQTTHALERYSVERPARLSTFLQRGNSGSAGPQGVTIVCVGALWAKPTATVMIM